VLGLEEPTERVAGAGGSAGASATASGASGGGGTAHGGAAPGGAGGSACAPEEPAGPGTELLPNGSFELGEASWIGSNVATFDASTETPFCGCRSAVLVLQDGYQELRGPLPPPAAGTVHGRARIRAPDSIDADILLRVDNATVEPPRPFDPDALDDEGADGWRTARGDWQMPSGGDAFFVVVFGNGTAGEEVRVDCVSLTRER
jgi:hypothetical protein